MSIADQQIEKKKSYTEAIRYMDNAKETIKKAGKEGNNYIDVKYVKTACGTAYNAVLLALDCYLKLKDVKRTGRKSIEYYQKEVSKLDKKLCTDFNNAYIILHLSGYYDGITYVNTVQDGFKLANLIIERIKPAA